MQETSSAANSARARDRDSALVRQASSIETFKRLIVAADGTWLNSDSGTLKESESIPSNVTRIARAIRPQGEDGVQQIVYYHRGVGSSPGIIDRVYGGITGEGLSENVREGYEFLASNWAPGDEIFFFGFSRGAFTARAIAGLIGEVGMLTKKGLPYLAEIFRDVMHRHDADYRPKHPDLPFRRKPAVGDEYRRQLERRGMTVLDVPIRAIGVWDTVGALGAPRIGWLERWGLQSSASKRMSFYDTRLSNCIEHAFQALALDERRTAFTPALWEKPAGNSTRLRQVWFPGVHSNVGGGYPDQELANITLAWMMSQVRPLLALDLDYVLDAQDASDAHYRATAQKIRPWSFGKIYNSMTGIYALGGSTVRSPGRYFVADPDTGRPTDAPLANTCEYVHPSVRARFALHGPGEDDRGRYDCAALADWKLVVDYPDESDYFSSVPTEVDARAASKVKRCGKPDVFWRLRSGQHNVSTRVLPESPLWPLERELLEIDPEFETFVVEPEATSRSGSGKGSYTRESKGHRRSARSSRRAYSKE